MRTLFFKVSLTECDNWQAKSKKRCYKSESSTIVLLQRSFVTFRPLGGLSFALACVERCSQTRVLKLLQFSEAPRLRRLHLLGRAKTIRP